MRLNIIPFPQLRKDFSIDGFLAFAARAIYVDQDQMLRNENRYRFTLAHEVAHLILRSKVYEEARIKTLPEYLAFQDAVDPDVRDAHEWQALNLAGRILLPKGPFIAACEKKLAPLRRKLPAKYEPRTLCGILANRVAPTFKVSYQTAETRLWGDGLCTNVGITKP